MQSKNHNSVERPSPRWRTTLAGGAAVTAAVTIVAAALACGPFFPNRFITGGDDVATQLASVNFRSMLKALTPKVSGGAVKLEGARYRYVEEMSDNGADIQNESRKELPQLRQFQLYDLGRECYSKKNLAGACAAWAELLALPAEQNRERAVWAAYMTGRALHATEPSKAVESYQQTRRLEAAGYADRLGLATASIGWEARIALDRHDYIRATGLYTEQYVAGDPSAQESIVTTMRAISHATAPQIDELARNLNARTLVTAWVAARPTASITNDIAGPDFCVRWVEALARNEIKDVPNAALVAWAAYQNGRFDLAKSWSEVAGADSTMGQWVHSKLLCREDKLDEAAKVLANVIRSQPDRNGLKLGYWWGGNEEYGWDSELPSALAHGELGLLQLTRSHYEEALGSFLDGKHWSDAEYVAERVLKPEELTAFIASRWPAAPQQAVADDMRDNMRDNMRHLCARRLVRLGRFDEAQAYLPAELKPVLAQYRAALATGRDPKVADAKRAQALITAARIGHNDGMSLMGTEGEPDFAIWDGDFETGHPLLRSEGREPQEDGKEPPPLLVRASNDEVERVKSSDSNPSKRFHYRYVAADLAWEAAVLMPDGDPKTAALLCEAGGWIKFADPKAADRFYKALVRRCGDTELGKQADKLRWFPKAVTTGENAEHAAQD
ncbi:MAG: hypothetical protein WCI96_10580 [Planctomycetota bacterium]